VEPFPHTPYLYLYLYAFFFIFFWTKERRVFNVREMSKTTSRIMKQLRSKLTRFQNQCQTHCGHDDLVQQAMSTRSQLERELENELLILCRKAGVE
jgi:hypothetical protein